MGLLDNKIIVITGATSGIGAATAVECARAGAKGVVVAGRREKDGTEVANYINGRFGSGRACFVRCDVDDESTVEALFRSAVATYGRVDGVFNNAGRGTPITALEDIPRDELEALFRTNAGGVFLVMKHAIKLFLKQETLPGALADLEKESAFTRSCGIQTKPLPPGYSIVNCSSIATQRTFGAIIYETSKHAVDGMTRGAAKEYAKHNIRVNSVHPGVIDTPFWSDRDLMAGVSSQNPMSRPGMPSEIARPVVFLLSDWGSYMTGSKVIIDGGAAL